MQENVVIHIITYTLSVYENVLVRTPNASLGLSVSFVVPLQRRFRWNKLAVPQEDRLELQAIPACSCLDKSGFDVVIWTEGVSE